MQNIQQIQVIHKALDFERNILLTELAKLNDIIAKKSANIQKISAYQKEYSEGESLQLSRATPTLHTNLYSFTKKIMSIIAKEEIELNKLQVQKETLSQRILKIDLKIKIIVHFETKIMRLRYEKAERLEQNTIDDLVGSKRNEHE